MIRFQIVERTGAKLYKRLLAAMRSGELRTFVATKRGRKITHVSRSLHGWMNWSSSHGVIGCEVISPRKPGTEWQLFSKFLGRLADRYADNITAINIQFPDAVPAEARSRKGSRRKRRAR